MHIANVPSYLKKNINRIIFSFYLCAVLNSYLFLQFSPLFEESTLYIILFLIIIVITFAIFYKLIPFLFKAISKISLSPQKSTKQKLLKIFLITFFICSSILIIWFLAFKPGCFSADSISQYRQALTGEYNDWHPTIHTLLFFTVPISIFHNVAAIVIIQLLLFAIVLSYSATIIYKYAGKKWCIISLVLILANPFVLNELMFPWKDVAFAIFALLSCTITLEIYKTRGEWCNKILHVIILASILGLTALFRHNAILFALPLIVFLFFFVQRKQWVKLFVLFLATVFIIKVPLYSILNVQPPDRRTEETAGLPLTILSNIAKETPEKLDEETSSFLYKVAPAEKYHNNYITGNFNSIKWSGIDSEVINETGLPQILKMSVKSTVASPKPSLTAFIKLTQVVYGIEGEVSDKVIPYDTSNDEYGIRFSGNKTLNALATTYTNIYNDSILKYLSYTGVTILIILIFILAKNNWHKQGWKKLLLCTPILFYDFGTMLLLTGPESRFFFINLIVYPTIIILSISSNTPNKTKQIKATKKA